MCVCVCVCVHFVVGVSTCDVFDDDNAPLMILEYMPYGDLHAFLERNESVPHNSNIHFSSQ